MVIEVSLRVVEVVLGAEHGGAEFFGGRLTVGAGDADDGYVEMSAPSTCKVLQFGQGIIAADDVRSALRTRLLDEVVAVEMLALQRHEDTSGYHFAAVGCDIQRVLTLKIIFVFSHFRIYAHFLILAQNYNKNRTYANKKRKIAPKDDFLSRKIRRLV